MTVTVIIISVVALVVGGYAHIKMGKDNIVEKAADEVILEETGVPVDIGAAVDEGEEIIENVEGCKTK